MTAIRKRNKDETRALTGMINDLESLQLDMALFRRTKDLVPAGWDGLEDMAPCRPAKRKVTIRLEADVADWYRHLGHGYQNRINQVLRAYMRAIVSKHIESKDDRDWMNLPI